MLCEKETWQRGKDTRQSSLDRGDTENALSMFSDIKIIFQTYFHQLQSRLISDKFYV